MTKRREISGRGSDSGGGRETAGTLRARAARVRKHARGLAGDPAAKRLEQLAQDLDMQAAELEVVTAPAAHPKEC